MPWKFLGRLAFTAVATLLLLSHSEVQEVVATLQIADWTALLAALVLVASQFLVATLRWGAILRQLSTEAIKLTRTAIANGAAYLYGSLLPSTVGPDLIRVGMMSETVGPRIATYSVVIDRTSGLITLAFLILGAMPFFATRIDHDRLVPLALVAIACLAGLVILWFASTRKDRTPSRLRQQLFIISNGIKEAFLDRRLRIPVLLGGFGIHLSSVVIIYFIAKAIGVDLPFADCFLIVPASLLIASLPFSINGWGLREGAMAAGFNMLGEPIGGVVVVSVLYGFTSVLIGLIYACFALFRSARSISGKGIR